ncbi:hypothetical protein E5D57_009272 [Metarhizium anisopliae]|nr:hypothetical protein E5D57_009272 [Metarhizium anisopliae]
MVPDEVWAQVPPDPDIMELEEERAQLKQGRYRIAGSENEEKIRELTDKIRTKKAEREKRIVKDYREYYFYHRPTWDIEAQARGEVEEQYEEPVIDLVVPERARLAEILYFQPKDLTEEQISCIRTEAVDFMVALCDKRNTGKVRQTRPRAPPQPQVQQFIKEESPGFEAWYEPDLFPLLMDASQCPDCIGDERLTAAERTFQWCRPTIRNDHFDDQHLTDREATAERGEALVCKHPKCKDETFEHLDHFRNHVWSVHKVLLRTSEQVNRRRLRQEQRRQMIRGAKAQRQQRYSDTYIVAARRALKLARRLGHGDDFIQAEVDVAEVREAGRQKMHMGVVDPRHDEARAQVMHDNVVFARGGQDRLRRAHERKHALGRHDEGLGPWLLLVNRKHAAVDVGRGVFEAGRGWTRSHWGLQEKKSFTSISRHFC